MTSIQDRWELAEEFPHEVTLPDEPEAVRNHPGHSSQKSHGRRGVKGVDQAKWDEAAKAGEVLNGGGLLDDDSDPTGMIRDGIDMWLGGQSGVDTIREGMAHPNAATPSAALVRTVAAAPTTDRRLYRGMSDVPEGKVPKPGDTFELAPTSFTSRMETAQNYLRGVGNPGTRSVFIELKPGSRSLSIEKEVAKTNPGLESEREWLSMGKFEVIDVVGDEELMIVDIRQVD